MPHETKQSSIYFDVFELDPIQHKLFRDGREVGLPLQAFTILFLFASHPDKIFTREEIKERLWPNDSTGDFDSRINFGVRQIRRALRDDFEQPRYLKTFRNLGYQFIAPIRPPLAPSPNLGESQHLVTKDSASERQPKPPRKQPTFQVLANRALISLLILVTVMIITAAILFLALRNSSQQLVLKIEPNSFKDDHSPQIISVSPILPEARQKIVIEGHGFGLHVPYFHTDSPYLAIRNETRHWAAGRTIPQNSDRVTLDVDSWTDTQIVISGFSGEYGLGFWKLNTGDVLEIALWNPQTEVGPASFHTTVVSGTNSQ